MMTKRFTVLGKVSYPQGDGFLTSLSFYNKEYGEMFTLQADSTESVSDINYGDEVTLTVAKMAAEKEVGANSTDQTANADTTGV
ncbi:hypothetical protein [Megasphaera vaginalis (ex Srinivasan et al. 2021)]|nr:hypothetical protein [Megasphaera vaginalis (ex Srinivasan et al. 2021)]